MTEWIRRPSHFFDNGSCVGVQRMQMLVAMASSSSKKRVANTLYDGRPFTISSEKSAVVRFRQEGSQSVINLGIAPRLFGADQDESMHQSVECIRSPRGQNQSQNRRVQSSTMQSSANCRKFVGNCPPHEARRS